MRRAGGALALLAFASTLPGQDPLARLAASDALIRIGCDGAGLLRFHAVAVPVLDGRALARDIEQLVRSLGLHAARKTTEHRGIPVHRLVLFGVTTLHHAITDRIAAAGLGAAGASRIVEMYVWSGDRLASRYIW